MLQFEKAGFGYTGGEESSTVLTDITFEVTPGEFVALLGENGAGKSTLCKLANGLLKPATGRVLVAGEDTRLVKVSHIAQKVGYLFQNPDRQLCRNTVREEILFGLEFALASVSSGTKAQRAKAAAELEAEKNRRCEEMLNLFRLDGNRDPFGLSRGERQQCALASVLARRPELLILDEPTTGLDYRECVTIMEIIMRLNEKTSEGDHGTTVFMITHDMEVAADYAQRALVLSGGAIVGDGPVREILRDKALLDRASLLPPQIAALSMRMSNLGQTDPFKDIFSLDEMSAAVEQVVPGGTT
jgi:energy-coupling factor transport system ATP-binding protein